MAAMDAIMELARHNQIKVSLVPRPPLIFVLRSLVCIPILKLEKQRRDAFF